MQRFSGSHVGLEDAKLLIPAFELERKATQDRVLMINATIAFIVEHDLHDSYLMMSAFELKHHSCVCLEIRV